MAIPSRLVIHDSPDIKPLVGYDIAVTPTDPKSQTDSTQADSARASQAMSWLAEPAAGPNTGAHAGRTPNEPKAEPADVADSASVNNLNDPNDPDAKDLPPGVVLPDAKFYAMRQLKAQMINFIAISFFVLGWSVLVIPEKPKVGLVCSGITVALTLFTIARFWFARRAWLATAAPEDQA